MSVTDVGAGGGGVVDLALLEGGPRARRKAAVSSPVGSPTTPVVPPSDWYLSITALLIARPPVSVGSMIVAFAGAPGTSSRPGHR